MCRITWCVFIGCLFTSSHDVTSSSVHDNLITPHRTSYLHINSTCCGFGFFRLKPFALARTARGEKDWRGVGWCGVPPAQMPRSRPIFSSSLSYSTTSKYNYIRSKSIYTEHFHLACSSLGPQLSDPNTQNSSCLLIVIQVCRNLPDLFGVLSVPLNPAPVRARVGYLLHNDLHAFDLGPHAASLRYLFHMHLLVHSCYTETKDDAQK